MNVESRTNNSLKNLSNGMIVKALIMTMGFVVRSVFIQSLDQVYLGVNGLFSNILTILSLAELGFGSAIVYGMYKPLAVNDIHKLQALMALYKKVYRIIGSIVLGAGLLVIPFMDYLIKDQPDIGHLTLIYVLYLLNSVVSYWFFSYKRSILIADQREYIVNRYKYIWTILKSLLQIGILVVFRNFLLYLIIQIVSVILENMMVAQKANKLYPFITKPAAAGLSGAEIKKIRKDVYALFLSKFGHVIMNGTDNIIISSFIGVLWVGLLSNYVLVIDSINSFFGQILSSLTASIGNYMARESREDSFKLFKDIDFLNYWIYGFGFIAFVTLLNPFIELWIGSEYLLSKPITVVLACNFLIQGIMNTLWTFRSTLGLFVQGKYRPIFTALINITLSVVFAFRLGIMGVLLATSLSRFFVNLWYDPLIIHKYGFHEKVRYYYFDYLRRAAHLAAITLLLHLISRFIFINGVGLISFIVMMVLTGFIPNMVFWLFYHQKAEFIYFIKIFYQVRNRCILFLQSKEILQNKKRG